MIEIVYEDDFLIGAVKPPGVPSQPDKTGDADMIMLLTDYEKERGITCPYIGLVHRLDRPVGGVMVFAKSQEANRLLSGMVQKNQIQKEYIAVVQGTLEQKEGRAEHFLYKNGKTNLSVVVSPQTKGAKKAVLDYCIVETIEKAGEILSLVKVKLHTGRHHQIRVQLAELGIPICGDQKYGNGKKKMSVALFSYCLKLQHPKTKQEVVLQAIPKQEVFLLFQKAFGAALTTFGK